MIGVLGAMDQEVALIGARLEGASGTTVGPRRFSRGRIGGHDVVVSISGFGKVAAASAVTSMIDRFGVTAVIFTGVAGGVGPDVAVGDVVVADRLVQHDFDASPIFPRFTIPSLERTHLEADPTLTDALAEAARRVVLHPPPDVLAFGVSNPRVHRGTVASGDRFVDDAAEAASLVEALPGLLAVEMEGAAVAQVCLEREVPFGVVRTISDSADTEAATDFLRFVESVASPMGVAVVRQALDLLRDPA